MGEPASDAAFERLHPEVRRWIHEQGWPALRPVQAAAVGPILEGKRDVLISAGTAAGKTEAAFLPVVSAILAAPAESVQALYLSPLKALINDQHRRLVDIGRFGGLSVHRWHGDVDADAKAEVLEQPRGVLQITPESLEALFVLRGGKLKSIFGQLAYVVIDELHSFVGSERGKQLQSLLHRLELMLRRRVPRIGLSATLGDPRLAREFLRPGEPQRVLLLEGPGGRELRMQVRGYEDDGEGSSYGAIASHLFEVLRGRNNLVFANSRARVERTAEALQRMCAERHVPNEFWPHHGSLSKELREALEAQLVEGSLPVTAVCTSTLEMGIDVGELETVAQLGAPSSVAALRQRLGRSGRRGGSAVLRAYVSEPPITALSPPQDRLREELVQATAACNLLVRGWCEPPALGALHLSTLVHQVLSLLAQHGSVRADEAFGALCRNGPFAAVDAPTFAALLRAMGARELVAQQGDGSLVVGLQGERELTRHTFYSAFRAAEEYRLIHEGTTLGTLPVDVALPEGATLLFAGRRWRVLATDREARALIVAPGAGGEPPKFGTGGGEVHEELRLEMRRLYESDEVPAFLDRGARELLAEARAEFARFGLARRHAVEHMGDTLLFFWRGDRVLNALTALLATRRLQTGREGLAIRVERITPARLAPHLQALVDAGPADAAELAATIANKDSEKFDVYLSEELLALDYASRRLDVEGAHESLAACAASVDELE